MREIYICIGQGDPSGAITDAAIAVWLRGLPDLGRFSEVTAAELGVGDRRIVEAVARLPAALCGITTGQRSDILTASVQRADPEGAEKLSEEAESFDNAVEVLTCCTEFVSFGAPAKRDGRPTIEIDAGPQPLKSLEGLHVAEAAARAA